MSISGAPPRGFGIYIHWPFCLSKCPYCDFNSHVRAQVDHERWRRALLAELAHYAAQTPGRTVTSIFFGGGTPSLMPPALVAALIEAVARHWPVDPALEITLEANPTSVEAERFQALAAAGVNRVSLGVQALDDAALRFLGRGHDQQEALAAVDLARATFPRFSFDLIYARPGQTVAAWQAELARALERAGDHLSLYTLTIEANTGFAGAVKRGEWAPPDDAAVAALYEVTGEAMARAGLPAYEISNHARPGGECRHNLTYWRYGDYAGIGPGAHGRLQGAGGRQATRNLRRPETWLERVEATGAGLEAAEPVERGDAATEALMMGLRLAEGVHEDNLRAICGRGFAEVIDGAALQRLSEGGMVQRNGDRLTATPRGRAVLDSVLAALLV
jgi:putative oxygen-independent coproporphyrinogen III oxidase